MLSIKEIVLGFTLHRRKFENSLKAYKISLNVDKTKLVLFVSPKKKLDNNLKTKLNGKRLFETDELSVRIVITWKLEIYDVCFL